jgi:hypothetical protein
MSKEIKLSGGEITMLKTIGLGGGTLSGRLLIGRANEMEEAEFLDTLYGLLTMGYVLSSKVNVQYMEDVERASFRVNPSYAKDLKEAIRPQTRSKDARQRRRG